MKKVDLQPIKIRIEVIKAIRAFFEQQHFQEIIPPTFNRALPLEPTLYAFSTDWHPGDRIQKLYLSVSPESGLKKMMAQGVGNCFAIGKSFRDLEGSGVRHNPEFLMLEWYRVQERAPRIMQDTQELVRFVKTWVDEYLHRQPQATLHYGDLELDLGGDWPQVSLAALVEDKVEVSMQDLVDERVLRTVMTERGYDITQASWEQLFNQLVLNEVESDFPTQPFFLTDFPARLSPLCARQTERPYLADRFEVFMAGMEIGNGNTENTTAELVQQAFEQEAEIRAQQGATVPPIDNEFVQALTELATSEWAGIGLGVDRLAMLMANVSDIKAVEPFAL